MGAVIGPLLWVKELPSCSGARVMQERVSPWQGDCQILSRVAALAAKTAPCYTGCAPILLFGVLQSGWRSQTIEGQLSITCRWAFVPTGGCNAEFEIVFVIGVLRIVSAAAP